MAEPGKQMEQDQLSEPGSPQQEAPLSELEDDEVLLQLEEPQLELDEVHVHLWSRSSCSG